MNNNKPRIHCLKNGPLRVENINSLSKVGGEKIPVKQIMVLCRCGKSNNKPFCDNAHIAFGFDDSKKEGRCPNKVKDYVGKNITIHDNQGVCSHAAYCTKYSPRVFNVDKKPWIDPNGDHDLEQTKTTIKMCPSGALAYTTKEEKYIDQKRDPAIFIEPDGPYQVVGGPIFTDSEENKPQSKEHYTLCRCGQ